MSEARLPVNIERGSVGGPGFKTSVSALRSGFEKRNPDWVRARGKWDISYGVQSQTDWVNVLHHFYAHMGKAHAFRFKDWLDFNIPDLGEVATVQTIGLGDGATTQWQVFKRYTAADGSVYDRPIHKIVTGTDALFFDATPQTRVASSPGAGQYSIDVNTGVVTTGTAAASTGGTGPGGEVKVRFSGEYDNHVRFDTDELAMTAVVFDSDGKASVGRVPIVEVRPNVGIAIASVPGGE